jgi:hypothetical protein
MTFRIFRPCFYRFYQYKNIVILTMSIFLKQHRDFDHDKAASLWTPCLWTIRSGVRRPARKGAPAVVAGDEVVVAAAVERQLDGKHAFRHVRRQHAVALSNIVKTWSNIVSKRGQQSSKHMVNNRQNTWSTIVKNRWTGCIAPLTLTLTLMLKFQRMRSSSWWGLVVVEVYRLTRSISRWDLCKLDFLLIWIVDEAAFWCIRCRIHDFFIFGCIRRRIHEFLNILCIMRRIHNFLHYLCIRRRIRQSLCPCPGGGAYLMAHTQYEY